MDKKQLRKLSVKQRDSLTKDEVTKKSKQIFKKLCDIEEFKNAELILCYASYKNEVETSDIMNYAWNNNIKLALPKVEGPDMKFYIVRSIDDLQEGYMSIPEPLTKDEVTSEEVKDALMIMPGTSFDKKLNRNGYGGGYYDRYLEKYHPFCVIGVAYEFQIYDNIPSEKHDKKADYIVSEVKIYGK